MVDCDVVADLMEVYLSGEGSIATNELVEAHLETCAKCRVVFHDAEALELALHELPMPDREPRAKEFVFMLKRFTFGVVTALLMSLAFLLTLTLVVLREVLVGDTSPLINQSAATSFWLLIGLLSIAFYAGIRRQIHRHAKTRALIATRFGALAIFGMAALFLMVVWGSVGTLIIGGIMMSLYVYLIKWRQGQHGENRVEEFFLSLETIIPLVVLAVSLTFGTYLQIFFITGFLVAALVDTFIHLEKLPNMILLSSLALMLPIGFSITRMLLLSS
jgi:hypothetical protein